MTPEQEYQNRLGTRRAAVDGLDRLHLSIGNARLGVVVAAAAIAWLSFGSHALSPMWLLVPGAAFVAMLVWHERVLRSREGAQRAVRFYEAGLARMEDRWSDPDRPPLSDPGDRFLNPSHTYAIDLDLFGRGSLFELLNTARTPSGEETLARWLCEPAGLDEIRARNAAIGELRGNLDLREEIALLGEVVRTGVHSEPLARWGEGAARLDSPIARWAAIGLALFAATAAVLWMTLGWRPLFLFAIVMELAFAWRLRPAVRYVLDAAEQPEHDLPLLSQVLSVIEREPFSSPLLVRLKADMATGGMPPSLRIARLDRLIILLDSRRNALFAPFAGLLLWATNLAFVIEAWRRESGPAIRRWLNTVGQFEALCALAGYSFEHPADPFPEFWADEVCFDAEGLAHPLLPSARVVANDVKLHRELPLLVISGSNMSGKSTLLRTVGINAALAMAGAPVRARRLVLSPVAIGASIRITDSLREGHSRFYAEIKRLRQIVDLTKGGQSLLFLLDELLNGTNSNDRRIGATGVVGRLVEFGAIGLITTHDLALTQIAEQVNPVGRNVHFQDHLENGRMSFDYRLREGVVTKSNALELMRSVGLDV